ncbi:MAG: membrane protein insertase YidC [Ruthenibacterium sp.]
MYILATPLGFIMEWIYKVIPNYGWALILFTILTKVAMFPLSIKQQKSTARMSAFQPMIKEIQDKWAKDKQRQNEEMMKFQQEAGLSMTAGCLPMAANMLVLFGLIYVVYRPLQYILRIPADAIDAAVKFAQLPATNPAIQNTLMNLVKENPAQYASFFGDKLADIQNFNMMFCGIDLSQMPQWGFNLVAMISIVLPVLSVVTMIASQVITMKMTGQEMQGAMKWMPWIMSIMFGYFCFTVPVGFSLYYTASNVLMLAQSIILQKMYNPEKIKAQIKAEMEAKRAEKKKKKQVIVQTDDGKTVEKDVTEAELARIRLAKARALDEERYKD